MRPHEDPTDVQVVTNLLFFDPLAVEDKDVDVADPIERHAGEVLTFECPP